MNKLIYLIHKSELMLISVLPISPLYFTVILALTLLVLLGVFFYFYLRPRHSAARADSAIKIHSERLHQISSDYQSGRADAISAIISATPLNQGTVRFSFNIHVPHLPNDLRSRYVLLALSSSMFAYDEPISYPTISDCESSGAEKEHAAILIQDFHSNDNVQYRQFSNGKDVEFWVEDRDSSSVKFDFSTTTVIYPIRSMPPFHQFVCRFQIQKRNGNELTVLTLRYPHSIAVRSRGDRPEYYSLGATSEDGRHQDKFMFFREKVIDVFHLFGNNDSSQLSAPGLQLLGGAISVFSLGIALLLLRVVKNESAAVEAAVPFFVLGIAPGFVEAYRRQRVFFPSAVINRTSVILRIVVAVTLFQGVAIASVGLSLLLLPKCDRDWVELAMLVSGGLLGIGFVVYSISLQIGLRQGFRCDRCGRKVRLRTLEVADPIHGMSICYSCYSGKEGPMLFLAKGCRKLRTVLLEPLTSWASNTRG